MNRLKISYAAALAGITVALGGCSSTSYNGYGIGPLIAQGQSNTGIDVVNVLRKAVTTVDKGEPLVKDSCFGESADETCKPGRNRVIAALRIASDDLCQTHIRGIYGNETTANILTGTGATLTSAGATVTGSTQAKTALSAASTFFSSERSLFNEVYFKEQVSTAITAKIRETRAEKGIRLDEKYSKTIADYSLMQALSDIVSYHYTCSFVYGLEKALAEGHTSSNEIKRSKLEQERLQLQNTLDIRAAKGLSSDTDKGLISRLEAIDAELLRLSSGEKAK